ncbi:hypothetical protein [Arthrobacter sp.]
MDEIHAALERTATTVSTRVKSVFDDLESIATSVSAVAEGTTGMPPRSS